MSIRIGADVGGTFTDIVIELANGSYSSTKVLTTHDAPEVGILDGIGRIAAQAAKGAIREKVKEAERDKIFEDFQGREEIETCEIRRFERGGAIIVALQTSDQEQTVEAMLPRDQQIPHETYRMGKQIRCVITEVRKDHDKKNTSITV